MEILITVLSLGLLVFIHELGHYLVARLFKVKIETFSVGFGPKIFKFVKNGTEYVIALIPLGGYVKMKGQGDDEELQAEGASDDSFSTKKWWQRSLIVFGGPVFNLFLAVVLITLSFLMGRTFSDLHPVIYSASECYAGHFEPGDKVLEVNSQGIRSFSEIFGYLKEHEENSFVLKRNEEEIKVAFFIDSRVNFYRDLVPVTSNVVGEVTVGLPAWRAGVRNGDRVLKIDGVETNNWYEVRNQIINSENDTIMLTVEREGNTLEITVIPETNLLSESNARIIGIVQALDLTLYERYNLFESMKFGVLTTASFVYLNYRAIYLLVTNPANLKSSIGGPIMLYQMTAQTSRRGMSDLLLLVAAISVLLMIMNLLPIPVFDGGHIMFFLFEGIFRKPIPIRIQSFLQRIGLVILLSLMLLAFCGDISRVHQRHSANVRQEIIE